MAYFIEKNREWQTEKLNKQAKDGEDLRIRALEDEKASLVREAEARRQGPHLVPRANLVPMYAASFVWLYHYSAVFGCRPQHATSPARLQRPPLLFDGMLHCLSLALCNNGNELLYFCSNMVRLSYPVEG